VACGGRAIDDPLSAPPSESDDPDPGRGDEPAGDDSDAELPSPGTGGSEGSSPPFTKAGSEGFFQLRGAGISVTTREFDGKLLYIIEFSANNTTVTADLDGVLIETGVAGQMPVQLSACEESSDDWETCIISVQSLGAGPSGSLADRRLQGFGARSSYEGEAYRGADSWGAYLEPTSLILDTTRVESEELNFHYPLLVSDISIWCVQSVCEVDVLAKLP